MKLAASNLAWPTDANDAAAAILRDSGASGVELAPGKAWLKPVDATDGEILAVRHFWESRGFEVVAFQAIIFGCPDLLLFGPNQARSAFLDYLDRIFRLAGGVGATTLVFGSPRNRALNGESLGAARLAAVEFFREAGARAARHGVVLALEANPPEYGCDFVTRTAEAAELVRAVDHPGFALHLDAGGLILSGDTPDDAGDLPPAHLHLSEPNLAPLGTTPGDPHAPIAAGLRRIGYNGWHSIEVKQPDADWQGALTKSLAVARRRYGA